MIFSFYQGFELIILEYEGALYQVEVEVTLEFC